MLLERECVLLSHIFSLNMNEQMKENLKLLYSFRYSISGLVENYVHPF